MEWSGGRAWHLPRLMSKCTAGSSRLFVVFISFKVFLIKVLYIVHLQSAKMLTNGLDMASIRYNRNTFVSVEAIIINNLDLLFGGMEIKSAHVFRTTRNADVARNEEEAEDLLEMITDEVRLRSSQFQIFFTIIYEC